jgi:hypothetical protein
MAIWSHRSVAKPTPGGANRGWFSLCRHCYAPEMLTRVVDETAVQAPGA